MRRNLSVIAALGIVAAACSTGVPADVVSTTPVTTIVSVATTTAFPATTVPPATTTTVPDTEPPQLTIVDPVEGIPVTTRKYEFRGTTEPGATVVAAGRYEVDVGEDGSWSMLLVLDRGGNLALFTATDAAGNATEERMTVVYEPPITSPDYWTGRTVSWERSGIGRWAAVEDQPLMWEQAATSLGGSRTGHLLSITPPTERDPAQPKESLVWVLNGEVITAALHLEIPAGREVSLDCYPVDGSPGDRPDLVGVVAAGGEPAQPAPLWRLGGGIVAAGTAGFVCEA
jgi:hypothetical protein